MKGRREGGRGGRRGVGKEGRREGGEGAQGDEGRRVYLTHSVTRHPRLCGIETKRSKATSLVSQKF